MGSEPGPTAELVRFGRLLRAHGASVGAGQVLSYTRAVADLDPAGIDDLYWAGRITLVNRKVDLAIYDAVFDAFFIGSENDSPPPLLPLASADGDDGDPASVSFGTDRQEIELLDVGDEELPAAGGPRGIERRGAANQALRPVDRRGVPPTGSPAPRSPTSAETKPPHPPLPERPADRPAPQRPPLPPLRG